MDASSTIRYRQPWNKGRLVAQKAPLKVKDIWPSVFGCNCSGASAILHWSI